MPRKVKPELKDRIEQVKFFDENPYYKVTCIYYNNWPITSVTTNYEKACELYEQCVQQCERDQETIRRIKEQRRVTQKSWSHRKLIS